MTDQPDFIYFECPDCGFDSVQRAGFTGSTSCPFCAGDCGHDVEMKERVCREDDKPEGFDARKGTRVEQQQAGEPRRLTFIPCSPDEISYAIADNGLSITFHPCGLTSHHPEDVAKRYCAACHRFMDLLERVRELKKRL